MYVTTIDIVGLTAEEYRAVLNKMGVETHPAANIFLHLATTIEGGYRIVEIWDSKEGFEEFLQKRLAPANQALGINRDAKISITPLHNFFGPRLESFRASSALFQAHLIVRLPNPGRYSVRDHFKFKL